MLYVVERLLKGFQGGREWLSVIIKLVESFVVEINGVKEAIRCRCEMREGVYFRFSYILLDPLGIGISSASIPSSQCILWNSIYSKFDFGSNRPWISILIRTSLGSLLTLQADKYWAWCFIWTQTSFGFNLLINVQHRNEHKIM